MNKLTLVKPFTNYSFEIDNENDLLKTFPVKEQRRVVLPSKLVFPLRTQYYFTWVSPDGLYAYLVFKKPEWAGPKGVVFRGRNTGVSPTAAMCDWCHSFGGSNEIGMMLTSVNPNRSVGMNLCLDLSCIEKTETIALIAGKNFEKLADKVCQAIVGFYEHILKTPS